MENVHCLKAAEDLFIITKTCIEEMITCNFCNKRPFNLRQNIVTAPERFGWGCLCVPQFSAKAALNRKGAL